MIDICIKMPRRAAVFTPDFYWSRRCNLKENYAHPCWVLGAFQDENIPVFTCEFPDGDVFNVPTEKVRFVDKEELENENNCH